MAPLPISPSSSAWASNRLTGPWLKPAARAPRPMPNEPTSAGLSMPTRSDQRPMAMPPMPMPSMTSEKPAEGTQRGTANSAAMVFKPTTTPYMPPTAKLISKSETTATAQA